MCRIAQKIPLYRIGSRTKDRELVKAVAFLSPLLQITPEGVVSASYLYSLLIFLGMTVILYTFGITLLIGVLLSLLAAIMTYYIVVTYPISVMNGYKLGLSEEADLVFEQFILVFQAGGTIFDAIEMVANSNHPLLSATFRDFLLDIDKGVTPEECISEFAKNQPSEDLRRYLIAILSSLEKKTDLLEMLSGESFEADTSLRQRNLEIESRLLIVAALVTYIPIMFTLAVSLGGYATNIVVLLIAPFFVGLNAILRSRFSRSFSAYFDRPQDTGITMPTQKEIIAEYDEFLNFMILLGERLKMGDVLEVALPAVREDVGPEVQKIIEPAIRSVYWENRSLEEAMELASKAALGQRVSNLIGMVTRMALASAIEAGDRISRISARLVKRSAVAKERDSIIAAQKLKVLLLSITSAIVLGLLTSLAPFLFIGQLLAGEPGWLPGTNVVMDILPLIIALGITTASTGYQNTKMVGGSRSTIIGAICLLLYLISFVLSSGIMGLGLV
jgi:hypothetical protein